jgi:hypothetical protein
MMDNSLAALPPKDKPVFIFKPYSRRVRIRRVKRKIIALYCAEKLSEATVTRTFELFPELRSA